MFGERSCKLPMGVGRIVSLPPNFVGFNVFNGPVLNLNNILADIDNFRIIFIDKYSIYITSLFLMSLSKVLK